jgi:hypothetical protein
MKKSRYLIFPLILGLQTYAQGTLETIFYRLPSEYSMFIDMEDKKAKIAEMKENTDPESGSFIDERNGYLRWIGYQCTYELCYWKNFKADSTGVSPKNLVAVVHGCQNKPDFLIEENGKFIKTQFDVFDTFDARYFFKRDVKSSAVKPYLDYFSFTLPRKGYTITAHYGGAYGEKDGSELLKGDKIDFIWKDNGFEMGKPYF